MSRILLTLALFAVCLVAAVAMLGLIVGDLHDHPSANAIQLANVHRVLGLIAALFVLLCNSIVVTYFVGTSRWCKEVVETYKLDAKYIADANRLKRKAFPWAVCAMLAMVAVVALGGAADPATGRPGTAGWVNFHLAGGLTGLGFVALAFYVEWNYVAANYRIIDAVMREVREIRAAKGLDTETNSAMRP